MKNPNTHRVPTSRIAFVDVVRGIALVAMTIYHFTWDLEFFGWLAPAFTLQFEWVVFARCIATSFLYLVGVSLVLAHGDGVRWPTFRKRLLQVAAAAALISVVTYFAVPGGFIFFGILHGIALFSVLGLLFVRLHWVFSAATAILILLVWQNLAHEVFYHPTLWWVGLAPVPPPSNDYVPLFPWFAATLAGIAFSKIATLLGLWKPFAKAHLPAPIEKPLLFVGRHSLVYYLLHQPAMMAAIWLFTTIVGEPDKTPVFVYQCKVECGRTNGPLFCTPYCECMAVEMDKAGVLKPFINRSMSKPQNTKLLEVRDICVAAQK